MEPQYQFDSGNHTHWALQIFGLCGFVSDELASAIGNTFKSGDVGGYDLSLGK